MTSIQIRRVELLMLAILTALAPFAPSSPVLAQDEIIAGEPFGGVDVIFIIDQSASMEGCPYYSTDPERCEGHAHPQPNDPLDLRIQSIGFALDRLGYDSIYSGIVEERPLVEHRIAVVSFGTDARIDLPLTPLGGYSEEQWPEVFREITSKIHPDDMDKTDYIAALEKARKLCEDAQLEEEQPPGPRVKAIIILTDGKPSAKSLPNLLERCGTDQAKEKCVWYTGEGDERKYDPNKHCFNGYFRKMKEHISLYFPPAPKPQSTEGWHIWVVAMNDVGEPSYWPEMKAYWEDDPGIVGLHEEKINGAKELRPNSQQIATDNNWDVVDAIWRILNTLIMPSEVLPARFFVPPYLDRAIFSIIKSRQDTIVEIYRSDGTKMQEGDDDVIRKVEFGSTIERWFIQRPTAGMWEWHKDARSEAVIYFDHLFTALTPVGPTDIQIPFSEVVPTYKAIDKDGKLVTETVTFPLQLSATLADPNGTSQEIDATTLGGGDLTVLPVNPIVPVLPGVYTMTVTGTVIGPNNETFVIFSGDENSFSVGTIEPSLIDTEELYAPYRDYKVLYKLYDERDREVKVAPTAPLIFQGEVSFEEGAPRSYQFQPEGDGVYDADVYLGGDGTYALQASGTWEDPAGTEVSLFSHRDSIEVDCIEGYQKVLADTVPQNRPVTITYYVTSCSGLAFAPDPQHPLSVKGTVQKPSGASVDIMFDWDNQTQAYVAEVPDQEVDEIGDHQIAVVAWGENMAGDEEEAFRADGEFTTYKTTPVELAIVQPQPGARLPIRTSPRIPLVPKTGQPTEVALAVELSDAQGDPVDPTLITTRALDDLLVFQLLDATGNTLSSDLLFEKDPASTNRLKATSNKLTEEGEYTFEACLHDSLFRKEYVPIQGQTCDRVSFTRYDPTKRITTRLVGIEAFMGLMLAALTIIEALRRTNPMPGALVFLRPSGERLTEPIKLPRRRWATLKGKRIPDAVRRMGSIDKLRVSNDKGNLTITYKGGRIEEPTIIGKLRSRLGFKTYRLSGQTTIEPGRIGRVGKLRAKYEAPTRAGPARPWRRPFRGRSRRPPR